MDTKTPPIPLKHHPERVQFKKTGRACEVSLPPLTPPKNQRPKVKPPGSPWVRNAPELHRVGNNNHSEHPHRVLNIGATPLMHACQQADRARVLRLLKEQRNTIEFRDRTLRSALHYCMDAGTGGAVATAAPELVNAPDAEGHTPLHLAVIAGDAHLVAVLLANGADVNAKDLEGHSVLHWATVCGEIECVRLVLAAGARPSTPDTRGGSPLHYAAQCCGAAVTAELAVPKKVGLKVLQTLLDYGADCNAKDADGRQPILWAASAGSVEAVLALARAGGSTAAGASDKDGLTALHCAASRGHTGCVEALVNLCGAQPDHVDDNGCSALYYAATLGHADATALLLRLGADPNRQDRKGRTPALCAAAKGQLETLKILAQHGGSLHARTVRGSGVAHEAAASGRVELIKWLAKKRPGTLDIATQDGRTPLHVAALHGHVDTCKVLLDSGARVNAILRTTKGSQMTALDAALYRGHRDCAKLIQMHGGTTAHQIRLQKVPRYKEFSTKLRVKHSDTSSNSENDSEPRPIRRRRRGSRGSELYYEERWEKRRTRRRDSPRKSERNGSRSYSEEEVRSSKETRRRHGRRTRSESARYERGKKKRKSKSCKIGYEEGRGCSITSSSLDSSEGEAEGEGRRRRATISTKSVSKSKRVTKPDNETVDFEGKAEETPSDSEDSLEVVVVRKSVEKKSEKVISGRRSKTPRERGKSSRKSNGTKSQGTPRSPKDDEEDRGGEEAPFDPENAGSVETEEAKRAEDDKRPEDGEKMTVTLGEVEERYQGNQVLGERESRYEIDAADSTSQEAGEQVVVTAIVHKDQASDTPKSTSVDTSSRNGDSDKVEAGEQVERNSEAEARDMETKRVRPGSSRPGGSSAKSRMEQTLEEADEMQRILVRKAANLKRGIEDWREHANEENGNVVGEARGAEEGLVDEEDAGESRVEHRSSKESAIPGDEGSRASRSGRTKEGGQEQRSGVNEEVEIGTTGSSRSADTPAKERGTPEAGPRREESASAQSSDVDKLRSEKSGRKSSSRSSGMKSRLSTAAEKISPSTSPEKSSGEVSSTGRKSPDRSQKSDTLRTHSKNSIDGNKGLIEVVDETPNVTRNNDALRRTSSGDPGQFSDHGAEEGSAEFTKEAPSLVKESSIAEEDGTSSKQGDDDTQEEFQSKVEEGGGLEDNWEQRPSSLEEAGRKSRSRPSTAKAKRRGSGRRSSSSGSPTKRGLIERSGDSSPVRGAIVAVIESPEWAEDEEEAIDKEIREAIGNDPEIDTDIEDNSVGVMRVLPSTSDDETPSVIGGLPRRTGQDRLPQVAPKPRPRFLRGQSPAGEQRSKHQRIRQRRDSGGRDSGIEPSPRTSRIPRRTFKCYPNTEKQQTLHMETVTRDVQVSLRRYHLERKIFFQLMELKRLQIRHGRANEHVLVKRQVEAFHKTGATGPTLGVAKYDQPLTFRHFESFLYEQLRRLQKRPGTPDWCVDAKYCTQKTHRCHHATSAYTSLPIYTYLGGVGDREGCLLPTIEGRGKGQMTVEVSHGAEKQVIALPAEKLDRSKRYFVTFTVRGESQASDKTKSSLGLRKFTKSI